MRTASAMVAVALLAAFGVCADSDGDGAATIAAGESLFNRNCTVCHGKAGAGGRSRPLAGRTFDAQYLFTTISKGRKRGSLLMPPWEKTLREEQRWQLVAYIQSLGTPAE